ncbi:MAG: HAD hydrolase-like protein [Clostridia bacterium]|nr:HAD hydrolase-like protein [Clostridia bacterium]
MKKSVIFDLDGTLLDTSEGILFCYKKAAETVGLEENPVDNKSIVIGGPLSDGFKKLYKIQSEQQLDEVIKIYRGLYKDYGTTLYRPYEHIEDVLKSLKEKGYILAVATLKLEEYAVKMLSSINFDGYFTVIKGWNGGKVCSKSDILESVLSETKTDKSEAVLVGDSEYDRKGAENAEIDFVGVGYGFGYKLEDMNNYSFDILKTPSEIPCIIDNL